MGSVLSTFWSTRIPTKILLVGIDNSGKTTICNYLSTHISFNSQVYSIDTLPTIGYNIRTVQYRNIEFVIFDCGGSEISQGVYPANNNHSYSDNEYDEHSNITGNYGEYGPIWNEYYHNVSGVIFVVDSADIERLHTGRHNACNALHLIFEDVEMCDAVLLVLCNKQDLSSACSVAQIADGLQLKKLNKNIKWWCQGTVGTTGDGVMEVCRIYLICSSLHAMVY